MSGLPFVPFLAFVFLVSCSGHRAVAEQEQRSGVPATAREAALLTFIFSEPCCGGAVVGFSGKDTDRVSFEEPWPWFAKTCAQYSGPLPS